LWNGFHQLVQLPEEKSRHERFLLLLLLVAPDSADYHAFPRHLSKQGELDPQSSCLVRCAQAAGADWPYPGSSSAPSLFAA
jgi:hypothetical protein